MLYFSPIKIQHIQVRKTKKSKTTYKSQVLRSSELRQIFCCRKPKNLCKLCYKTWMSIIQLSINEFPVDKSQQRRFTKHKTRTQLENAQHGNLHHNRKITQKFQLHKTCSKSRGEKKKYNRRSKLSITLHIKKLHWRITVQLPGLSMQHFSVPYSIPWDSHKTSWCEAHKSICIFNI